MANSTREIRRRVRSVKSIRQITRAMELVAAAKMQRAVTAVQSSRRYADLAWGMLRSITVGMDFRSHPLLASRPRQRMLVILLASNRGLAGGFNARVTDAARQYMAEQRKQTPDLEIETASLGKKGRDDLLKHGHKLVAEFERSERAITSADVVPIAKMIFQDYEGGKCDVVTIVYTDFISMLRQEPRVKEILPITTRDPHLGFIRGVADMEIDTEDKAEGYWQHLFEPDLESVLGATIPRLLDAQLYQALLESVASEHAARMMAMRNASDAAVDLIDDLTLTYNQLRQSSITQELSEISAGRLALGV